MLKIDGSSMNFLYCHILISFMRKYIDKIAKILLAIIQGEFQRCDRIDSIDYIETNRHLNEIDES